MIDFKFPFVGKGKGTGEIVLFLSESVARDVGGQTRDIDVRTWCDEYAIEYFSDVTKSFLDGSYIEVYCLDQIKFIYSIASRYGFKFSTSKITLNSESDEASGYTYLKFSGSSIDVFYIEPEGAEIVLPIGEIEILTDDFLSEAQQ